MTTKAGELLRGMSQSIVKHIKTMVIAEQMVDMQHVFVHKLLLEFWLPAIVLLLAILYYLLTLILSFILFSGGIPAGSLTSQERNWNETVSTLFEGVAF